MRRRPVEATAGAPGLGIDRAVRQDIAVPRRSPLIARRRGARRRRRGRFDSRRVAVVLAYVVLVVALWQGFRHVAPRPSHERPQALSPDEARIANAAIPFAPGPVPRAPPFRFHGSPAAREQAVECLATAALYEAGDDADDQHAVMQVVLNRLRLPGYPKTVCGVVYQGATLATGCQFSFACDGSVTRRREHEGWAAARRRARRALAGDVFAPVGTATHYHADYVLPYWLGSLDKTATVHAHIFYRPRGPRTDNPAAPAGTELVADGRGPRT